jgi:hypothetical protein
VLVKAGSLSEANVFAFRLVQSLLTSQSSFPLLEIRDVDHVQGKLHS